MGTRGYTLTQKKGETVLATWTVWETTNDSSNPVKLGAYD
jgi:hypothetical protein